jgi:hypothetical protein
MSWVCHCPYPSPLLPVKAEPSFPFLLAILRSRYLYFRSIARLCPPHPMATLLPSTACAPSATESPCTPKSPSPPPRSCPLVVGLHTAPETTGHVFFIHRPAPHQRQPPPAVATLSFTLTPCTSPTPPTVPMTSPLTPHWHPLSLRPPSPWSGSFDEPPLPVTLKLEPSRRCGAVGLLPDPPQRRLSSESAGHRRRRLPGMRASMFWHARVGWAS